MKQWSFIVSGGKIGRQASEAMQKADGFGYVLGKNDKPEYAPIFKNEKDAIEFAKLSGGTVTRIYRKVSREKARAEKREREIMERWGGLA